MEDARARLATLRRLHTASAVTRTSTVASVRGGWAARGERCVANSPRVVAALRGEKRDIITSVKFAEKLQERGASVPTSA